jgi:hypothetical protein
MSLPAFMAPKAPARSLTTVLNFPGGGGAAKATPLAGFPLQSQALDNWCWAAVAAGVDAVRGAQQSQCTIAGRYGGVTGDPQVAGKLQPPTCPPRIANDTIGYLNEVLDCLGLSRSTFASITDGAAVETQARADLKQKRPVPFRIAWSGSGDGHFLAIVGASDQGLLVYDPAESKASVNHLVTVTAVQLSKGGYDGAGKWSHVYPVN